MALAVVTTGIALRSTHQSSIANARKAFRALSEEVIPLAEGDSDYVLLTCSMAHGGDWVQSKGEVRNPYFGKAMLTCGAPKKVN